MKSTTKFNKIPIFLTILFLVPYFKLLNSIIIEKSIDITFLELISIFISLILIGIIWTKYFYDTPRLSKNAIEVNLEGVLNDYNRLNSLADYKYRDKFFKLTGTFESISIIDKDNIEIELLSDSTYKVIGTTICPRSKYKRYIKKLNKDDDITVGCFITRDRNKIYLDIDYIFYNTQNTKKAIKGEISCTKISFEKNKIKYFFSIAIYVVTIGLIISVLNYNIVIAVVLIFILILLYKANIKYSNKNVDISNLSIEDILKDYNSSEEDADFKYNNKYIEIYGVVESINIMDDEDVNINFLSNYGYTVSCDGRCITQDCLDYLKHISKGDKLRIKADFFRENSELRLLMWYIIS